MAIIYIAGAPCTGKTTLAQSLTSKIDSVLIPTDIIKYTLREFYKDDPTHIIHKSTFNAYANYCNTFSDENLVKYAKKLSDEVLQYIKININNFITTREHIIIEGAHLYPSLLQKNNLLNYEYYYFLLSPNNIEHNKRIENRSLKDKEYSNYKNLILKFNKVFNREIKIINKNAYLLNSSTIDKNISDILKIININQKIF